MVGVTWLLLAMLLAGALGLAPRLKNQHWLGLLGLAAITAVGAWLRFRFVPFHHAMYVDEPWYQEAARNVLAGRGLVICDAGCTPYIKSAGWPAILALAFKVADGSDHTAFVTSALLGVTAIPLVAFVTRAAGGSWPNALFASALLSFHPVHLQWSTTAETNVAAVTLLLCGLGGTLIYSRSSTWPALLVALGGLGSAAAVRPELWLAFAPAAPILLRRSISSLVVVAVAVLSALPGFASRGAFSTHTKGELFQWSNTGTNAEAWLGSALELGRLSTLILILATWGLIRCFRLGRRDAALLLGGSSILIGTFVLFYYPPAGFYSRTMLGAVAPAAVLAGLYIPDRRPALAAGWALVAIAAVGAWVWSHREDWSRVSDTQLAETKLPELAAAFTWPADASLFAVQPTVLNGLSGPRLLPMSAAQDSNLSTGRAYIACDMFCEPHFGGGDDKSDCTEVLRNYLLEPASVSNGPHRNYGIYRVVGRSPIPIERPICPLVH